MCGKMQLKWTPNIPKWELFQELESQNVPIFGTKVDL